MKMKKNKEHVMCEVDSPEQLILFSSFKKRFIGKKN